MKIIKWFRKNFKIGSLFCCRNAQSEWKKNSIVKSCCSLSFPFHMLRKTYGIFSVNP